jgi:hypothetical protein
LNFVVVVVGVSDFVVVVVVVTVIFLDAYAVMGA